MTLQDSAERLRNFDEVDFRTRGNSVKTGVQGVLGSYVRLFSFLNKIREEAHVKARRFEKKLLSQTRREEDLAEDLKFMLEIYSEAVLQFRKDGCRDDKYLPKWDRFSATILDHANKDQQRHQAW